tara:strand:+ start:1932 stop:4121 length:2190 start_codon:yes stop_codon:yes gene_type:complete
MASCLLALLVLLAVPGTAAMQEANLRTLDEKKTKVERIRFVHLTKKPFDNSYLRSAMTTRKGETFRRRQLLKDLTALENLYRGIGFLDADIVGKEYLLDNKGRLHIRLKIDSGERWRIEEIRFLHQTNKDTANLTLNDLNQHLELGKGSFFKYKTVLEDERTLLALLNNRGYAHAKVRNKIELDPHRKYACVTYEINTGRRMYFGPVSIRARAEDRNLRTQYELVRGLLAFRQGQLFDPEQLRITRNNLSRTGLFRSVTLNTLMISDADSLQPVEIWLQERKFIHVEANAFMNNTEPGLATNFLHSNWLGRGTRIGLDGSLGRPIQGSTFYVTERNIFDLGADLTVSAGMTDEWGQRKVFADPTDSMQVALLSENDSILNEVLLFSGTLDAAEYIGSSIYSYRSVERLWQFKSVLSRRWDPVNAARYHTHINLNWVASRNRPTSDATIGYNSPGSAGALEASESPSNDENDSFEEEGPFDDEDPFGDEDPFEEVDSMGVSGSSLEGSAANLIDNGCDPDDEDYACGDIQMNNTWQEILTDEARTLNLSVSLQRDSRDNQIAPARGTLLRAAALYAVQFGGRSTRVLDGDVEWRHYLRLGPNVVWAAAARCLLTTTIKKNRPLPQAYWIEFGGEGSVRGVDRKSIQAIGGGRSGVNVRSELRFTIADFGVVAFWDRAGVWRYARTATWSSMVNGYGFGARYERGIPFRLDVGWSEDLAKRSIYFSIGQAF